MIRTTIRTREERALLIRKRARNARRDWRHMAADIRAEYGAPVKG